MPAAEHKIYECLQARGETQALHKVCTRSQTRHDTIMQPISSSLSQHGRSVYMEVGW